MFQSSIGLTPAVGPPLRRSLTSREIEAIIDLFNSGHGYDYVANIFQCDRGFLKDLKYRMKKKGVNVRDLPRDGGIKHPREHYTKLFSHQENADRAIQMLKDGRTYREIGVELGCDRTSVLDFHWRIVKQGILPKFLDGKRLGVRATAARPPRAKLARKPVLDYKPKSALIVDVGDERRNQGRTYKEYSMVYIRRMKEVDKKKRAEARIRLEEVRKNKIQ